MHLTTDRTDPLHVLRSTRSVLENARTVQIHTDKIATVASALEQELASPRIRKATTGTLEYETQKVFVENTLNFCFWAEYNAQKWAVEWPLGVVTNGGWFSLVAALDRAEENGFPIYDATYLSCLCLRDAREIFRGITSTSIPLFKERVKNLREAGRVLCDTAHSSFLHLLQATNHDAINLTRALTLNFPSFDDTASLRGEQIYFHKRAQICAHDIALLGNSFPEMQLENIEHLTGFADYRLPQVFRHFGVLEYSPYLAQIIDSHTLLGAGNKMEIEIRSATVWIIELLRQYMDSAYTAAAIDNAVWDVSQKIKKEMLPHHRTYTIYY